MLHKTIAFLMIIMYRCVLRALEHVNTTAATVHLLRRNMYTSMLHRQSVYWLDLMSKGWFGRDDNESMVAATNAIWGNGSQVLRQWQQMLALPARRAQLLPAAEVAIFVDEISAAARPLLGRGGTIPLGYQFESALGQRPWQDIAGIGAPVRVFLLSDLLLPEFPSADIKMSIFLNAFMLSRELRTAIRSKLQIDAKLTAFVYTAGLYDTTTCKVDACVPAIGTASELIGLSIKMNKVAGPVVTKFEDTRVPSMAGPGMPLDLSNVTYGEQLGIVSPRFECGMADSHSFEWSVLGRYTSGAPAICWSRLKTNASSVVIGTPRPPVALWRALAKSVGVHLYTEGAATRDDFGEVDGAHADAVEVGASGLLYHSGAGGLARPRQVVLPEPFGVRSEWGDEVCAASAPCSSFTTPQLADGESVLYWLSPATQPSP